MKVLLYFIFLFVCLPSFAQDKFTIKLHNHSNSIVIDEDHIIDYDFLNQRIQISDSAKKVISLCWGNWYSLKDIILSVFFNDSNIYSLLLIPSDMSVLPPLPCVYFDQNGLVYDSKGYFKFEYDRELLFWNKRNMTDEHWQKYKEVVARIESIEVGKSILIERNRRISRGLIILSPK